MVSPALQHREGKGAAARLPLQRPVGKISLRHRQGAQSRGRAHQHARGRHIARIRGRRSADPVRLRSGAQAHRRRDGDAAAHLQQSLMISKFFLVAIIALLAPSSFAQSKPGEWERIVELGKKEGKVVISIPATSELRQALEDGFKKRYGINVESVPARGTTVTRRIVEETKAGISYFDIHIGGSESIVTGLLSENVLEPVEPYFILPQVNDRSEENTSELQSLAYFVF